MLHHRERQDGTRQVRLRITRQGVRFWDTGVRVREKEWNAKAQPHKADWIKSANRDYETLNDFLDGVYRRAAELARQHPHLLAEGLQDRIAEQDHAAAQAPAEAAPPDTDFVAYAQAYVAERSLRDNPNTVLFYRDAVRDLVAWRAGRPWPFAQLTEDSIFEFHDWLLHKPVYPGTARDRITKLSTIAAKAVKRGLLDYAKNPFRDLDLPKVANKKPVTRPSLDQLQRLIDLDLSGVLPRFRQRLEDRRRAWLFQHYIRGVRAGDVLLLRERDVRADRLVFRELKTGKIKSARRTPAIDAILAHYPPTGNPLAFVFPFLDHERAYAAEFPTLAQQQQRAYALRLQIQYLNGGLKWLCRLAGVPPFTSHAARHLFVDRLVAAKVSTREISGLLNHSAESVTRRYMQSMGYDELDEAAAKAFG
ncbi:hypothetical protein GCM10023186_42380 [Hymenobacter koreensis]|uniref:Tyr recombinase domain-containing protein n=1 Tax=Hymenobacter koreensis TaxID=1084523 RepID=A0ABP8JK96_9BACT